MAKPLVAVLMGSSSDLPAMQPAADMLAELGIPVEVRVMSAHRTPDIAIEFARGARGAGYQVLICGAGGAAHLAGVIAANSLLPVIGVPLKRSLDGLDALYATVQMPPGIPVATVAIDGSLNAGLLAAHIMALSDEVLAGKLAAWRKKKSDSVIASDDDVRIKASRL